MKRWLSAGVLGVFLATGRAAAQEPEPTPSTVVVQDAGAAPLRGWFDRGDNDGYGQGYDRAWASAELLIWWTKGAPVNSPLLTSAPAFVGPADLNVDSPTATVAIGNRDYGLGTRFGGRFVVGTWLPNSDIIGVEASYFFLSPDSTTQSVATDGLPGSPVLATPFIDVTGQENNLLLGGPIVGLTVPANASIHLRNQLQGAEGSFVINLLTSGESSLTGIVGYRYLNFKEDLEFSIGNSGPASVFGAIDLFNARNNFHGGQVGLRGESRRGNFILGASGKVALGSNRQQMFINGVSNSVAAPPFGFTNAPGAVYAQPSNIGEYSQDVFCVVPEVELKLGYQIARNLQGFIGYNFLYISNVARAGESIDRNLNLTQVPGIAGFPNAPVGPPVPSFTFQRTDFWAHGINLGFLFTF